MILSSTVVIKFSDGALLIKTWGGFIPVAFTTVPNEVYEEIIEDNGFDAGDVM